MTTTEMLAARRELAAKKLADLGWHVNDCVPWRPLALDANRTTRIWPAGDPVEYWCIGDESGRCVVKDGGYESFDAAVDAAHAAKFPERQPLDETTFKRLIDEGQQDMKAFEAERRGGFPRKSDGRTAELNEPVTMPDEDCCETSQTDLQTAEIERNWNDVAWLQAELTKARDRIAKQATKAAEKRTAYNAEIDGLRAALLEAGTLANKRGEEIARLTTANTAENQRPLATFDAEKRAWTVQVGILTVQVARVVDNVTAVIDGLGFLGSVTVKGSAEHLIPLVGHMLSFCGIRVQE